MTDAGELHCLERLFAPLSSEEFVAQYWPSRAHVSHGPLSRLGALANVPEFADLGLLLSTYRQPIRVALADKRDEHHSALVDGPTAASMHREGMALIFDDVPRFFPLVDRWLETLRRELGLPRRCNPRSILYASPAGSGNSPHFDANANFVVQLRGTKRWTVAPNRHVENPTDRWAMNQDETPEELRGYLEAPLPTRMPEDAEVIELTPGSVLFVPRGHWHATEANEDTLALNFTYGQPTWADVVLGRLRSRLLGDPRWRALATRTPSPDWERMQGELVSAAGSLDPSALVDEPAWLLAPSGFLRVEGGSAWGTVGGRREFELAVSEALHPTLSWISEQPGPFSLAQMARAFPDHASGLPALVELLASLGVLERADDEP